MRVHGRHAELPRVKGFGTAILPAAFGFQPVLRLLQPGNTVPQPRHQGFGVQLFLRWTVQRWTGDGQAAADRARNWQRVGTHNIKLSGSFLDQ
jgi:hypothetical protein